MDSRKLLSVVGDHLCFTVTCYGLLQLSTKRQPSLWIPLAQKSETAQTIMRFKKPLWKQNTNECTLFSETHGISGYHQWHKPLTNLKRLSQNGKTNQIKPLAFKGTVSRIQCWLTFFLEAKFSSPWLLPWAAKSKNTWGNYLQKYLVSV